MSGRGEAFVAYLNENLKTIEDGVMAHVPVAAQQVGQSPDLDRYLYGPVARFVSSGGKRIRPALCLLGAKAVGADPKLALQAAAAVELFQAAALIHDDIADESTLRRGVPCVHVQEGVGLAINDGDAALVAVVGSILAAQSLSMQTRLDLLDEIVRMEERTLEGQALDLGWVRDNRWDIAVADYLYMARSKTAYYSAAVPLVLGAISGNGDRAQVEGLRRFGLDAGLAFQIQDDLLNLVGDAEAQGKDYRSDITEGKRTLVMVWALEHTDESQREELVRILSSKTSDPDLMNRAVEIAREAGAIDYAHAYARELVAHAKEELDGLRIAEDARVVLISMADFFIERTN